MRRFHGNSSSWASPETAAHSCGNIPISWELCFTLDEDMRQKDGTNGFVYIPSSALLGIQTPNKRRANLVVGSLLWNKNAGSQGSRNHISKSQVCRCNKWGRHHGNDWKLVRGQRDASGQSDWGQTVGSMRRFQSKVLVNFSKRRFLPLLPIRARSAFVLHLTHTSATLRPFCSPQVKWRPPGLKQQDVNTTHAFHRQL